MAKGSGEESSKKQFPVVGIGASAGGLNAVKAFLQALPAKSGMAFVFIQHLSPSHQSILPEILQKTTPFPVQSITDNIHLEPDNLYIIPQNKIVTTTDGILKLAPLDKKSKTNTIDLFFSSLGVVHQSYAVGIVLSGALSDGTRGLQVIKSYGGLTFAQDEESAAFDSMPNSAVRSGAVDFVMPPDKIAQHLIAINHPFHTDYSHSEIVNTIPQQDNETFKQILTVLRVRRGVDFTYYKQSTLKRRIIRRMALSKIEKPADYLNFLRENKTEQDSLYNDMLISVTNFFRDPQSFELLCNVIFPSLLSSKTENEALRIWIAGCATGEEAYSMAICLQELLGDKATARKIQIFATDISETAIAKARTGVYRPTELVGISTSRLQQFFTKQDGNYQVSKTIRDMCVFAHHNLLKDPPFSKIDLVSCRNVMIYLEPVLQKRALGTFHYSLNKDGFLMLGKSETIGGSTDIFTAYNLAEKIYLRKGPVGRFMTVSSPGREQSFREIDKNVQKESFNKDIFKIADETMLANFMPPAVVVNDKFDIVQFKGTTETWLVPPVGKPSFNVLKMAREGLAFELRNLLHLAKKTNLATRKFNVFFKINDLQHFVNLQVAPLPEAPEQHFLIVFQQASTIGIQPGMFDTGHTDENSNYNAAEMRIEHLERELMQTRADMRVIADEQEASNEELQSANEELLSGSEELQSLNEELETSKEELQSTNEEVMIVNKELLDRNEQLNNVRLYNEGIVSTIRDPLLILDKDLRIKRATGGFYAKFKITEKETEGQYIYDLGNNQWDIPSLRQLLDEILPEKKELEGFEVSHRFPVIGKKTMWLNAREIDNINGEKLILLSIEDITDKRTVEQGLAEAERLLLESKERLKFAVDSAGLGTWDYDPKSRELVWDKRCKEIFGLAPLGHVDLSAFFDTINPEDKTWVEQSVRKTLYQGTNGDFDIEYRTIPIDDNVKWLKAKGRAYFNEKGEPIRFIGTMLDITAQKQNDQANIELLKKKDEFLSIASHELKTPITSLKAALQMIERATANSDEMKTAHVFVQKGIKQVNKLVELIKDLLDVTKIQAGKLELNKTTFVLSELLAECCDQQSLAGTHQLIIDGETDVEVFADRNRIEQVMVNLLSNAIKYSPDEARIIINVGRIPEGIKIAVTDFGIGIAREKQSLLFDRFYRVDESSKRFTGLGLGLYISAEIIKRHNGRINVNSIEGKGSTFWFVIPAE
ncbi:two-component system CheB/CheR fusion protein [Mucilaginibacter gracilis]|uniref:Two-component system CheB/CheR fusion protein n=1 Tax=Mucilaginibacter gracilis TaxID=423350 RepID=A0A495J7W6_9SPHI|nr:CheR family methyltransferase [Mucilaginibacter gracilis]RKR84843.1 two-component system CheB/CheR fusion protein [Mucilaginibacter gracilis]